MELSLNTATVRKQWNLAQMIDGCARHGIRGVPSFLFLEAGGREQTRRVGEQSLEALQQGLEQNEQQGIHREPPEDAVVIDRDPDREGAPGTLLKGIDDGQPEPGKGDDNDEENRDRGRDACDRADAGTPEGAVVVGYSMGGPIAQLLWHRHPESVAGLVLCGFARGGELNVYAPDRPTVASVDRMVALRT